MRATLRLALGFAFLAGCGLVHAHAVLRASEPADGSRLDAAPERVVLRFNEPVQLVAARVIDVRGRDLVRPGGVSTEGNELVIALEPPIPDGVYLVSYRVVSLDAHPVSGGLAFGVGVQVAPGGMPLPPAADPWALPVSGNRFAHIAAVLVAAGAVLYLWLVAPRPVEAIRSTRSILWSAAAIGSVIAALGVGLQGALLALSEPQALTYPATWHLGATTTRATAFLLAALGMACIATGAAWAPRWAAASACAAGAACALAGFVVSGHAATLIPASTVVPLWLVHVTIAAFWIGSLLMLGRAAGHAGTELLGSLLRFSGIAGVAVPLMLLAGGIMAAIQIAEPAALISSRYGALVLAKGVAALGMLALAAYNRFDLVPRLARGDETARAELRLTIRVEWLLGLAVVALAAFLSQTPPPAGTEARPEPGQARSLADGAGRRASVRVESIAGGARSIKVRFFDATGRPLVPLEASAEFSNRASSVEPVVRRLLPDATGAFVYAGSELSLPGRWTIRVKALITDFEQANFAGEWTLR